MTIQTFIQLIKGGGNANGNYPSANGIAYPGPLGFVTANGNFAGASVSFETLPDGQTTWLAVPSSTLSAAGSLLVRLGIGEALRAVVSSAAAGTAIDVTWSPYVGGV